MFRPRDGCAIRARRVGGRQRDNLGFLVARAAEPVDGARERELQPAQAIDEVASPDLARLLHRSKHRIQGGKSAADVFSQRCFAGQNAVSLQERTGHRVEVLCGRHSRS